MGKRIAGAVGVFLGGVGVVLAVVSLIGVWTINTPLTEDILAFIRPVRDSLTFIDTNLNFITGAIQDVRDNLEQDAENISRRVEKFSVDIQNIRRTLDTARNTLKITQDVAAAADSLLLFVDESLLPDKGLAESLAQISPILDDADMLLAAVEAGVAPLGQGDGAGVAQLDANLADLQDSIAVMAADIAQINADAALLERQMPLIIDLASVLLSLLALWSGLAQYALLVNAWRWVRPPPDQVNPQ